MKVILILCSLAFASYLANSKCLATDCVGYDKSVATYAVQFATCSNLLTSFKKEIQDWSYKPCKAAQTKENMQDVKVIQNQEKYLLAFTAYDSQRNLIVVSFRGTVCGNSNSNIQLDANLISENYINTDIGGNCSQRLLNTKLRCNAHQGFYNGYKAIQQEVRRNTQALWQSHKSLNPKILVTGISLGGALAAFATFDLVTYFKYKKHAVNIVPYTFGQPRIGNQKFVTQIDKVITIFRVIHKSDPVPHMPTRHIVSTSTIKYFSPGVQIFYKSDDDNQPDICAGDGPTCSLNKFPEHSLCDHLVYPKINFASTASCNAKVCTPDYQISSADERTQTSCIMNFLTTYCKKICAQQIPPCLANYPPELKCDSTKERSHLYQEIVKIISPALLLVKKGQQKLGASICNMRICEQDQSKNLLASIIKAQEPQAEQL